MRRWIKIAAVLIVVAVLLLTAAGFYARSQLNPVARDWVQRALEEKFQSGVEVTEVDVTVRPHPVVTARGLKLRHQGRTDVPPLLIIEKLVIRSSYPALWADIKKIHAIEFHGLQIQLPPKVEGQPRFASFKSSGPGKPLPKFEIEKIVANGTLLRVLPRDPRREPLEWDIKKLTLDQVAPGQPMKFDATLVNAKPPGDIVSKGTFGPWNGAHPGESGVQGEYTFRNADLSAFNGIAGILSSDGTYKGVLERIEAEGTTDTPDFRLGARGHRVPLRTKFHSIIDGTNGDTTLDPVIAQLGSTTIICKGGVVGTPGVKGKTIDLATSITKGRIDDILRLTVRAAKPIMSGSMKMTAKFVVPPGDRDVIEKLRLNGRFSMDRVTFTNDELQDKIDSMSQKAQGKPKETAEGDIASHFDGKFRLTNANIMLDEMTFEIPGARVLLAGLYGVRSEQIAMTGQLRMQARISQTQTGWKSLVLKAVDPFFAKEGVGAVIPIKIEGTREAPHFGLQLRGKRNKDEERARKI